MNQTRTFLIFAWLTVAALLFMAWNREQAVSTAPSAATVTQATTPAAGSTVPSATASAVPAATPVAGASMQAAVDAGAGNNAAAMSASAPAISVTTDVLHLTLDGGAIREADLLRYPQNTDSGSEPVRLFAEDAEHFFQARSGWVSDNGAPSHESGFVPEAAVRDYRLADGAQQLVVPFVWHGDNDVSIRRTYTFTRGSYAVQLRDQVVNGGKAPWQGFVYRQLLRVPPIVQSGMTHPESYSFHGAAWFSSDDKFGKRKFTDYDDGPLDAEQPGGKQVTGGWVAMLQHHFFAGWIPQPDQKSLFSLQQHDGRYLIETKGPSFDLAPGASASTQARLWVGPKLVKQIQAQDVPGLERAVDFSSYSVMAWIAGLLFSVLSFLHGLIGNWGWSIIGLVIIVKGLMFPLSAAQYKSAAKMRRFQPRIEQLKERYGDDKQKFQMAMMELYKKEKINPVGGCLPVLLQMPVFLALYWVLLESVELRQAPWIGWIHNLTAPDPYFILPVINIAVMWATQKLTPTPGMDPMQKKMMQIMPLAMGVMFAFFPAGLVLYWVTNGSLGLLQQWWMTRRYGQPVSAKA